MAEKTLKPTSKRLRDARKRGEVVFSTEVASTVTFVTMIGALWLLGASGFGALRELWLHATGAELLAHPGVSFPALLRHAQAVVLWGVILITSLALLGGFAGSFFQVGGMAAWERLNPNVNHLNPAEGLKKIFSTRSVINLVRMVIKTALLAALMFVVVRSFLDTALRMGFAHPSATMVIAARMILTTFAWAAVIYATMAAIDYVHQHYEFMKQQRMSVDDVRREHKDMEGDPLNSSRRRSEYFQSVYFSLADRVRVASAVIHSTRVAVALQYLGEKDLPRVIASGENEVAAQIRRHATEALIPMEFDASLAERLYEEVPQDMSIPRALYAPVARLLRWAQGES